MSLAKDKYREETNEDCYCKAYQVEGGCYTDDYVLWLERELVNKNDTSQSSNNRYSEKNMDDAYDKGFKDGVNSYNNIT